MCAFKINLRHYIVAAVLDNGRKVLGTTSIDPNTKSVYHGTSMSMPDPFASLMSVTSQTEYAQRDAPAGETPVVNRWMATGGGRSELSWHDFQPSVSNMLDSVKCDIGRAVRVDPIKESNPR
jgi:hypothetical protein